MRASTIADLPCTHAVACFSLAWTHAIHTPVRSAHQSHSSHCHAYSSIAPHPLTHRHAPQYDFRPFSTKSRPALGRTHPAFRQVTPLPLPLRSPLPKVHVVALEVLDHHPQLQLHHAGRHRVEAEAVPRRVY